VQRRLPKTFTFFDPASHSADRSIAYLQSMTPRESFDRLRHGKFIADRNRHRISKSDALLCNLIGAKERVSIGSIGEIHWANAFAIPIIIIREHDGNVHDHSIVNALASELCFSIDDACCVLKGMFNQNKRRQSP
jgi:nucleoside 2-deoxyribosyltransferase